MFVRKTHRRTHGTDERERKREKGRREGYIPLVVSHSFLPSQYQDDGIEKGKNNNNLI
jgi:hypothetical protein